MPIRWGGLVALAVMVPLFLFWVKKYGWSMMTEPHLYAMYECPHCCWYGLRYGYKVCPMCTKELDWGLTKAKAHTEDQG